MENIYKQFQQVTRMQQSLLMQRNTESFIEIQEHSDHSFSEFQNKFETIKAFACDLRQLQIEITEKEDQEIASYTKAIVDYLSHPEALSNEKLYSNCLIGLGNFISIKFSFFRKQFLSQKFFKNLIEYFSILCLKQKSQDFNMLVYPVFYLIVLMIYNSDKDVTKMLYSQLFTRKFMRALSSVEFQNGNRVERYLPVIIAFIAKGSGNIQSKINLKQLVLNNLHFSQIDKNSFHFIYSLRVLINKQSFTLGQIRRYNLLDHLTKFLSNSKSSEQHLTMVLQVLKHILKRHQILSYRIISADFLNLLEKCYNITPLQTLSLLETIAPCLSYKYKQKMFQMHTYVLKSYQDQSNQFMDLKQLQSLKIISIIIQEISSQDLLVFLENISLDHILKRTFKVSKKLQHSEQQLIICLLGKTLKMLTKMNPKITKSIISIIKTYRTQNKRINSLLETYPDQVQPMSLCLQ